MYTLPALGYEYNALEPVISEEIMRLHHTKHHQAYVDKLNAALEGADGHEQPIEQLLRHLDDCDPAVRQAVRNNGGGHYNHSLFWQWLSPEGGGQPSGNLGAALKAHYGDFQHFVDRFSAEAVGLFGSGWVWLMPDLTIETSANQDNPIMDGRPSPILGLDVWEHAYYLDYKNQRDHYISAWWDLINWADVEKRYASGIIS